MSSKNNAETIVVVRARTSPRPLDLDLLMHVSIQPPNRGQLPFGSSRRDEVGVAWRDGPWPLWLSDPRLWNCKVMRARVVFEWQKETDGEPGLNGGVGFGLDPGGCLPYHCVVGLVSPVSLDCRLQAGNGSSALV